MSEKRWIEIQFYFICFDLYQLNNEFPDIMDYMQFISNVSPLNTTLLSECAHKSLTQAYLKPTRAEIIVLGAYNDIKMVNIKKYVSINNRDYYGIIEKARNDPPYLYCKFKTNEIEEMQKFVDFHNKLKGVGI